MSEKTSCPECGGTSTVIVDNQRGERVCNVCGIVISTILDQGPEWRAYSSEEESSRARGGAPLNMLRPDMGLRTRIGRTYKDAQGRSLPPSQINTFNRLATVDTRVQESELRNLRLAFRELNRLKSQMEIPEDVAQSAAAIYRKSLKANLIRGRSIDGVISACLYLACRHAKVPVTLKDVAVHANVNPKDLGRCVRILITELDVTTQPSDFVGLIYRLGESLNVTMATRKIAVDIIDEARDRGVTVGKNPMSMAAAALYIAGVRSGERRTQQQIAKVARTTPVTIRNRFKELVRALRMENLEVKRGAAAVPVYASDPRQFEQK